MPTKLKRALVNPLLKKRSLCKDTLSNYRPISNLSQLSKVILKVVANRLNTHLVNESLTDTFQSAYKRNHSTETALLWVVNEIRTALNRNHSTETALLWVVNEIRTALNRRQGTIAVLIDLSAAFDTIDDAILLNRL